MQGSGDHGSASRRRAAQAEAAGLALFFREGARPKPAALGGPAAAFALVPGPVTGDGSAEVLMAGFACQLLGLAPGPAARTSAPRHAYDLMLPALGRLEAVRVLPPEGDGSAGTRPVLRALVALGCELAGLPGLAGLGWEPAGTVMSPAYFLRVMQAWLGGGAFPGLGLAALVKDAQAVRSEGLALFAGHEIAVSLAAGGTPAGAAKLALRAMHGLVEDGVEPARLADHLGLARLPCAFYPDEGLLRIG